jgi:hypothetical protein
MFWVLVMILMALLLVANMMVLSISRDSLLNPLWTTKNHRSHYNKGTWSSSTFNHDQQPKLLVLELGILP